MKMEFSRKNTPDLLKLLLNLKSFPNNHFWQVSLNFLKIAMYLIFSFRKNNNPKILKICQIYMFFKICVGCLCLFDFSYIIYCQVNLIN